MTVLGLEDAYLLERGAQHTAQEIDRQPVAWARTQAVLDGMQAAIQVFLEPLLARSDLRIVLTGAGSSGFVGQCLAPELMGRLGRRVEAISTTDLIAAPHDLLQRDVPTLLVSFSRSGGSPESVAAIDLASRLIDRCQHLVITCNPLGALYRHAHERPASLTLLLPEEAHDRGFAMTVSVTSMLYAASALFGRIDVLRQRVDAIGRAARTVIDRHNGQLAALARRDFGRVIFLGGRGLAGLASEAALKTLELTDGAVVGAGYSSLAFRHGPKSIVNGATLVVLFITNDPLARRYDLDMLSELQRDGAAGALLAISAQPDAELTQLQRIIVSDMATAEDSELMLPYAALAQLYALHRSLALGLAPDQPCPSGRVNRVVRGVTIHPL